MAKVAAIKNPKKKETVKQFVIKDTKQDFHNEFGIIKKEDLAKDGILVTTNTNFELGVFEATFKDLFSKAKRSAQMIPLKDVGTIIVELGLGKESTVVEGGAGSGGLGCVLANICKKVYSYEIREDHKKIVEANIKTLNLQNQEVKLQDMTKQIDEENVDAVIIDLPSPWLAIEQALKAAKPGGFIVSYSPNISQVAEFIKQADEYNNLALIKTIEAIHREWTIKDRIQHPKSRDAIHSGFITILRKIAN